MGSEISTVEALDKTNSGLVPLTPSIKYNNQILTNNNISFSNEINLSNIKRNESSVGKPSDSSIIKLINSMNFNKKIDSLNLYNKINLTSNIADYASKTIQHWTMMFLKVR